MSRTYDEGTTDAEKEADYPGLSDHLDRLHALQNHDVAAAWGQGETHHIPRIEGPGEDVTITKVTPSYVYFTTQDGTKASISRGLLASLSADAEGSDGG